MLQKLLFLGIRSLKYIRLLTSLFPLYRPTLH